MSKVQHACESTNKVRDGRCRATWNVRWRERFRCWLCAVHFKEYEKRAEQVAQARIDGTRVPFTW